MWDFGEERTTIPLEGEDYHWGGVLASPPPQTQEEQLLVDQQRNTKNRFGVLRGCDERGDYYVMPNGELTPSLGARFRQFLAFQSGVDNIADGIQELLGQILNDFASEESAEQILEQIRQWKTSLKSKEVDRNDVQNLLNIIRGHTLSPLIQKNIAALSWASLNESTPLTELPPSLMFLVGLQFGQNQVGSWNPFTLAAKKYMARQFIDGPNNFFWPEKHQPTADIEDVLQYSFADLIAKIWPGREFDATIGEQFESAVLAYYAITQEILSHSKFKGNNQQNTRLKKVMRLEDMEAINEMAFNGNEFQGANIDSNAKRPALVSGSVGAHVASLDRPNNFPPPIRIITKYEEVHHAHIFGIHLFNVDFNNAARVIREVFNDEKNSGIPVGKYKDGCPFFKDPQRESLLIPHGLKVEICGVLASADDQDHSYVLASDDSYDSHTKEAALLDTLDIKVQHKIKFCRNPQTKKINAILKDYNIEKSTSTLRDDAYRPIRKKKGNQDSKYQQARDDIKKLSNVSIIVKQLKLDNIYRIKKG
jgi:hypothetical protein